MTRVDWDQFRANSDAIAFLKTLPRHRNTPLRSAWSRGRVFATLLHARLFRIDKPIFVVLVTNNHCDLKCTYCYGDYGHRKGYIDYTSGQLMKMIDELWDLGTRLLTIHGGEAMLRKDIIEVLNYCKLKGFYVSFNTNGLHVPQRISELRCLDSLVVSLDGREESNDKHRGAGNFATALRAIEAGAAASIPTVISATLTRDNMHDMEYLAELAQARRVRVQYSILYNSDDPRVAPMIMSESETRATAHEILALKRRGFPIYYSDNVLLTTIHWPAAHDKKFTKTDKEFSDQFRLVPCYHGKLKYQIDADGRVVECWATDYDHAPNIKDVGIAEAMRRVNRDKACYHCTLMANNEHNAFMHMSPRNLWNIFRIQVADSLKIRRKRTAPAPVAAAARLSDAAAAAAAAGLRAAAARAKAAGTPPVKKSGLVVVSPARAEEPGIPDHRAAGQ
jgi:MoaA/NifB/PqqE/SkfB family radical SAM enzyme